MTMILIAYIVASILTILERVSPKIFWKSVYFMMEMLLSFFTKGTGSRIQQSRNKNIRLKIPTLTRSQYRRRRLLTIANAQYKMNCEEEQEEENNNNNTDKKKKKTKRITLVSFGTIKIQYFQQETPVSKCLTEDDSVILSLSSWEENRQQPHSPMRRRRRHRQRRNNTTSLAIQEKSPNNNIPTNTIPTTESSSFTTPSETLLNLFKTITMMPTTTTRTSQKSLPLMISQPPSTWQRLSSVPFSSPLPLSHHYQQQQQHQCQCRV